LVHQTFLSGGGHETRVYSVCIIAGGLHAHKETLCWKCIVSFQGLPTVQFWSLAVWKYGGGRSVHFITWM